MDKEQVCLRFVAKKQDVFGNFTDWFQQEFDLPVAYLGSKRNVELYRMFCSEVSFNFHASGVTLSRIFLLLQRFVTMANEH